MNNRDAVVLTLWVIYDHPSDFPRHFVVRRHFVMRGAGEVVPPDLAPSGVIASDCPGVMIDRSGWLAPTLELARTAVPSGFFRTDRHPDDDPHIAEVWI